MMINSPRVTTSNLGMVKGTIKHITVLVSIRDFRTLLDRGVPDMLLRRRQSGVKSTVIFGLIRYKGEWRGDERGGKLGRTSFGAFTLRTIGCSLPMRTSS